jgi:hypothetical protein
MIVTAYYHRETDVVVLELRGEDTGIPDAVMDRVEAVSLLHEIDRALSHQAEARRQIRLSEGRLSAG